MAREKMSNTTAASAVVGAAGSESANEVAATPNPKYRSTSKKKATGKRGDPWSGNKTNSPRMQTNRKSNGTNTTPSQTIKTSSVRGAKTLGWYMDSSLFPDETNTKDKGTAPDSTPSSSPQLKSNNSKSHLNDSAEGTRVRLNHNRGDTPVTRNMDDDRKKRRLRQRNHRKGGSMNPEGVNANTGGSEAGAVDNKLTRARCEFKETCGNYWYYDSKTDGFYYDWKNTHGWRRRDPVRDQFFAPIYKESFAPLMIDPVPQLGDLNTTHPTYPNSPSGHFSPQYQYDSESDGYYFTMPSVDGWKKRQLVGGSSTVQGSNTCGRRGPTALLNPSSVAFTEEMTRTVFQQPTYVKGQQTQCTLMMNGNGIGFMTNKAMTEVYSSADSYSTVSSAENNSPSTKFSDYAQLFGDEPASCSDALTDRFDLTLVTEKRNGGQLIGLHRTSSCVGAPQQKTQRPFSYADVVNTSATSAGNQLNSSRTTTTANEIRRPGTLKLPSIEDSHVSDVNRKGLELTNFNADKFIADLPFTSSAERVLQNLSAMKTPCGPPSVCSIDSPHTPAPWKGFSSPVKQNFDASYEAACLESLITKLLFTADSEVIPDVSGSTRTTSKLSFWRDPGLVTGMAGLSCDAK